MASFKKILFASLLSATLIFIPMRSQAILPLIGGWIMTASGGSILVADLVMGQVGIISAVLWWDCNKFEFAAPCTSKSPIPSAQQPKPAITISLVPDKKRENPDSSKFNDPEEGRRDVTPKPSIASSGEGALPAAEGQATETGYYRQDPGDPNPDPTSYKTLQHIAKMGRLFGELQYVPVKGIIAVKQNNGTDLAIPFVAVTTSCWTDRSLPQAHPENQANLVYCQERYAERVGKLKNDYPPVNGRPVHQVRDEEFLLTSKQYVIGQVIFYTDLAQEVPFECDPGYQVNQRDVSSCVLTNADAVKKPADTTCEVLFDPATKRMLTDKANPACDGLSDTAKFSLAGKDGTIDVSARGDGGFDVCVTKPNGGKSCVDTGIYDPSTGGYVVVNTIVTPPPNPDTGLGCGGPGETVCSVVATSDSNMQQTQNDAVASVNSAIAEAKGKLDNIDPNKFRWSFIPEIPTTACTNPSLRNPITGGPVEMDICGGFNRFHFFLNAVLAIACVYGCVRQVQTAMKA